MNQTSSASSAFRPFRRHRAKICLSATGLLLLAGAAGLVISSRNNAGKPVAKPFVAADSNETTSFGIRKERGESSSMEPVASRPLDHVMRSISPAEESPLPGPVREETNPSLFSLNAAAALPDDNQSLAAAETFRIPFRSGYRTAGGGASSQFAPQGAGGLATQAEINAFIDGVEQSLTAMEQKLIAEVFGESLPLVGNKLAGLASNAATGGFEALHHFLGLKQAIKSGLGTLTSSATYTKAQVEEAVKTALSNASISFGSVTLDASNATDIKLTLATTKQFTPLVTALDSGLGFPGLGLETSGNAQTVFNYTLNFTIGVDSNGFYFSSANSTALSAGFTITVPNLDVTANLSKLRFHLRDESSTDGDADPPSSFTGTFALKLVDPNNDNKLRISELSGNLLAPTLTGTAALNLNLASDLGSAKFPEIFADLSLGWGFSAAPLSPSIPNTGFGNVPTVAFKNIKLDLGTFLTKFARPVLNEVREISQPVQPIIKAVQEPLPLLSQLHAITNAVPDSILAMGVASGSITQAQADRFDILTKVIEISNSIPPEGSGAGIMIDLGDFNLGAADPRALNFNIAGINPNKIRNAITAALQHPLAQEFLGKVNGFPKEALGGGQVSRGMEFPILDKPESVFGLLLGKNVDLFHMDNATQKISLFQLNEFIKIAYPLGFRFKGEGNVRADLDFGFDTKGIVQFAGSGDVENIFNGFYVDVPTNAAGMPISMAELNADFRASLAVNVVVGEAGAGGGLYANLHASLADPNGDKKVHLDEFIDQFSINPLCVLEADGSLDAGVHAYVTVGVDPLSHTEDFDFVRGTVVDFTFSCAEDPKPVLARVQTGDLRLHVGPDAPLRGVGNITDGAESFQVTHRTGSLGTEEVGVTYSVNGSSSKEFGALPYGPVSAAITADGGVDNDTITLAADVVTPAILKGNAGIDILTGGAGNDVLDGGADRDFLTGGAGNDTLLGGAGPDMLDGGPGADVLNGGAGTDSVSYAKASAGVTIDLTTGESTGEAAGDTFISVEQFEGTLFNDIMRGTAGSDVFDGLAGNDTLDGRDGDDLLQGGPGADHLIGGPGFDYTSYFHSPAGVNVNLLSLACTGGDAEGDVLEGIESIEGSLFDDVLTGDAAANIIYGRDGRDTINGGDGNDTLYGDEGGNVLDVRTPQQIKQEEDDPMAGADVINGGAGNDHIEAGRGMDIIDAGPGDDFVDGGSSGDVITAGEGNDYVLGGTGTDQVDLGPGDDFTAVVPDIPLPPEATLPFPQNIPYPRFENVNGVTRLVGVGGDNLVGGPGNDTVSFESMGVLAFSGLTTSAPFGVVVNLKTNATGLAAGETSISGFENVIGTNYGDDLTGDDGPNIFQPLRGGGLSTFATGGPDRINGGGGVDTLRIDFSRSDLPDAPGVTTNSNSIKREGYDSYIYDSVEKMELTGASKNDLLYSYFTGYDDILIGLGGNDFLGGRGGSDTLLGGEGNDSITGLGAFNFDRYGVIDGHDVLDGGPGDDIIEDVAFEFGSGVPKLAAGTLLQIDGGPGRDKISVNFSNQTVPIIWDSATPTNWEFADGAYARNFEEIDTIVTGPGNDSLTQRGRVNNSLYLGDGNDTANPGLGFDTVVGGPGVDTVILDYTVGEDADLGGVYPIDRGFERRITLTPFTIRDSVRIYEVEQFQITGTSKADTLYGGDGSDILRGGEGNDILRAWVGSDVIEGGPGNDELSGNRSGNGSFTSSDGYGQDRFDGGEGDDEILNVYYNGGFSNGYSYATTSTRMQLDGGPGTDTIGADFGNQTVPVQFIAGGSNSQEFPDGSYFRSMEKLRHFITGSGADRILLNDRSDQAIATLDGNDVVNPGVGIDEVRFGGGTDNLLVLDYTIGDDATVGGVVSNYSSYVRRNPTTDAVVDSLYVLQNNRVDLTGGSKNDLLWGTDGPDMIRGGGGNDDIVAYGGNDWIIGWSGSAAAANTEIDKMNGGNGADIFVLGDAKGRFYDDGAAGLPGLGGYANITDFNPAQGDKLRLAGNASEYLLGPSPISGITGTALFHDSNGNGTLEPGSDELIATLGTATINAANTLGTAASIVKPADLALIGLQGFQPSLITNTGDNRFALNFSITEPMPANLLLEVQVSSDLGAADPWKTIASKAGASPWTGQAATTVGVPSGGRASVSVVSTQSVLVAPKQYFRLQLSSY